MSLPFSAASSVEEQNYEEVADSHRCVQDIKEAATHEAATHEATAHEATAHEATAHEAATPATQSSSQNQANLMALPQRQLQFRPVTQSEEVIFPTDHISKATLSRRGSARKRKRSEVVDPRPDDDPRLLARKRKGGKRVAEERIASTRAMALSKQDVVGEGSNNEWEVECIVDSRIEADTYIHWYQVKWKGWGAKHNTWEPKKNLVSCQDLIEEFKVRQRKEAKTKRKQKGKD
ncbi:chromo (CHRromatin organization MOdifier) domain-containing protein [Cordyceps javanica]|uniref:Chromo (CHRromatin organization MOdifier) domain-containing protein n=1 Tax=Cordyceps javanica TaxID=43265 RepID=A0A545V5C2_9HYPO|nr:chromo (CHRromatin organization MOdifier) domain-containing protein [Cordyceps javanica]